MPAPTALLLKITLFSPQALAAGGITRPLRGPCTGGQRRTWGLVLSRLLLPVREVLRYLAVVPLAVGGSRGSVAAVGLAPHPSGAGGGFAPSPIYLVLPSQLIRAHQPDGL